MDQDRDRSAQRRHTNLAVKMNKPASSDVPGSVGTATSVPELQAIRAAQGIGSSERAQSYYSVYFECRRSDSTKHIDQMLGTGVICFPDTQTMLGELPVRCCSSSVA